MATAAQNIAATTTAIQAAATADLPLLQAYGTANGPAFTNIETTLATLGTTLSSTARQAQIVVISSFLAQALALYNQLVSDTTAAKTATPTA